MDVYSVPQFFQLVVASLIGLSGGGILLWILMRPQVHLSGTFTAGWTHLTRGGTEVKGTYIHITVPLRNGGSEATTIEACLTLDNQMEAMAATNGVPLEGRGTRKIVTFYFEIPALVYPPQTLLHGHIRMKPWGNRRVWGQQYLEADITIPPQGSVGALGIFS